MSIVVLLIAIAILCAAFAAQREQALRLRRNLDGAVKYRRRFFADYCAAQSALWAAQNDLARSERECAALRREIIKAAQAHKNLVNLATAAQAVYFDPAAAAAATAEYEMYLVDHG